MIHPSRIAVASVAVWCVLAGGVLAVGASQAVAIDPVLGQLVGGVSLAIALFSVLPLAVARQGSLRQQGAQVTGGVISSLALRSSLTILFLILVWKTGSAPRQTVGLWTIFWYATLLTTEVVVVVRFLGTRSVQRVTEPNA